MWFMSHIKQGHHILNSSRGQTKRNKRLPYWRKQVNFLVLFQLADVWWVTGEGWHELISTLPGCLNLMCSEYLCVYLLYPVCYELLEQLKYLKSFRLGRDGLSSSLWQINTLWPLSVRITSLFPLGQYWCLSLGEPKLHENLSCICTTLGPVTFLLFQCQKTQYLS